MSEPTFRGYELSIGVELGDAVPECCGDEMTGKPGARSGRDFTCGTCRTVLTVDKLGLVFDIRG